MTKISISGFLPLTVLGLSFSPNQAMAQEAKNANQPNIVLIFADDLGYGDLGSYGASGYKTPNLDRLASQGMRFTNFYAAQAVSSASRAGLLTGCYPNRIGISGALMPWSKIGLNPKETTLAEMLKPKGYVSAIVGKWHLGYQEEFLPLQHGFDEYYGLPYSNDMWPVNYDGKPITDSADYKIKYPPLYLIEGNKKTQLVRNLDEMTQLTTLYTQKSVDFIHRMKNQPFFLYLAHSMPHVPLAVSDKYKGKSEQGLFGDVIEELDWSVGEVMKALDENGLSENTIVLFTSDNGPWLCMGNHAGSTGGLREGKGTSYEGGQKEPCIVRWPGRVPAGRMGKWKLVFPHILESYEGVLPGKDGFPSSKIMRTAELALFDLHRDPGERYNVLAQYPEIVDSIQKIASQAREDLGDLLTGALGQNLREPGREKVDYSLFSQTIVHKAVGKTATSYSSDGSSQVISPGVLTDGFMLTRIDNYNDLRFWKGYEGTDMDVVIDLQKAEKVNSVDINFLHDSKQWIFRPESVRCSLSEDGKKYHEVGSVSFHIPLDRQQATSDGFSFKLGSRARYIRLKAENIKICPDGHIGKGQKAWIFADEIVVR